MQNNTFSTSFVGQNLIKLSVVDSTNSYLKSLTSKSEPLPNGTVIMADNQFAGRGQRDSVWQSEAGKNLTFSVFLKVDFLTPENQFSLNIAVSVSINNVLKVYLGDDVSIKWPNDIYFRNKKIGGILIENTIMGRALKHTIIGIGINVNQRVFGENLNTKVSSLAQILQQDVDLQCLLKQLCVALENGYLSLQNQGSTILQEIYVSKLYQINKSAFYKANGSIFEGVIMGVTCSGLLIIKRVNGDLIEFGLKEVEFL